MISTDYEKQATDFLEKFGIQFRATLSDSKTAPWRENERPHEFGEPHHYRVTLSKKGSMGDGLFYDASKFKAPRRLTFDFWGSIKDAEDGNTTVTAYDVLACISGGVHCPETFEDFCAEYGYESDSIKALQTFRRCAAFGKRLRAFFTEAEIEELQEIQ